MNLFEIENEIMNCWDQETGEIFDSKKMDQLEMARDTKIENIALYIKNLTADAEALKAEKQSFAERQKAAENKAEALKSLRDTSHPILPDRSSRRQEWQFHSERRQASMLRICHCFRANTLSSQIRRRTRQLLKTQLKRGRLLPEQRL